MTKRIIILDLDTPIGNKLYWFLKIIMEKFPNEIKELAQQFGRPTPTILTEVDK